MEDVDTWGFNLLKSYAVIPGISAAPQAEQNHDTKTMRHFTACQDLPGSSNNPTSNPDMSHAPAAEAKGLR